jgi:hypothetical protein
LPSSFASFFFARPIQQADKQRTAEGETANEFGKGRKGNNC